MGKECINTFMKRLVELFAVLGIALNAFAVCPFNIPEITLQPHQVAGFSWGLPIKPMNDACVNHIAVENGNQAAWYVGGFNGVYVTKTSGASWAKPLSGKVGALLWEPVHQFAYAGIANKLWFSRDHGLNWVPVQTFAKPIASLFAFSPTNTLYIGLAWDNHIDKPGIFTTNLGGGGPVFHPFGGNHTGLIVWTISRDPMSGALYAGTEIFDHQPQPYKPPFFRGTANAQVWTNVANNLPWHAIDSAVRPTGYVYALTEGSGLWGSSTMGNAWIAPSPATPSLGVSLLMDPNVTTRLYAGRLNGGTQTGGLWRSLNAGNTFGPIGLKGVTVADIALNGNATRIYVAAYASGVYTSPVP
jgi:hypothetical protein